MLEGRVMLAVIKTGGKQYKAREGEFFSVEKLSADKGQIVELKEVCLIDDNGKVTLGNPFVAGAVVIAEVVDHKRRDTVLIFKKSRRKNYRRKNGHRQSITVLKVNSIKH